MSPTLEQQETSSLKELLADLNTKKKKRGEDPQFQDVEVIESSETHQIILPLGMSATDARAWLQRWIEQQDQDVRISEVVDAFPLDGAVNLMMVLKDLFGWTTLESTPGFFGPQPPVQISVATGWRDSPTGPVPASVQVPWGRIGIPGIEGYLETGFSMKGKRPVFQLGGVVKRKHEKLIHGIAERVRASVVRNSIYRGQAIEINFRDEAGNPKPFNPGDSPRFFLKPGSVNEKELIFPADTQQMVNTTLYCPVMYSDQCRNMGIPLKRGTMLEGPFGVGKTLLARVMANKCVLSGWTFMYLKDVRDLDIALAWAELYPRCIVFAEDVDRAVGLERDSEVDRILNTLDGVSQKDNQISVILTTNEITKINQALIRPGRMDTVIPIRTPDELAAVRLISIYGRDDINMPQEIIDEVEHQLQHKGEVQEYKEEVTLAAYQKALAPLKGANAAVYREVIERAKLAMVWRACQAGQDPKKTKIRPEDTAVATRQMQYHIQLLAPRVRPDERPFALMGRAIAKGVNVALKTEDRTISEVEKDMDGYLGEPAKDPVTAGALSPFNGE